MTTLPSSPASNAARTPESRLGRSDSKIATRTCHGLTSNGVSCRRALAASKTRTSDPRHKFCWQHVDQADRIPLEADLATRSSLDSLVAKFQAVHLTHVSSASHHSYADTPRSVEAPITTQPRPQYGPVAPVRPDTSRSRKPFWARLCCMSSDSDNEDELYHNAIATSRPQLAEKPEIKIATQSALAIPSTVSAEVAQLLRTELAKPISPSDKEGYIYIFWLTDSPSAPTTAMTTSLLSTAQPQRADALLRSFSVKKPRPTIMIKIGRANNVHRRMNEWTKQCGHSLSLIRWYPYSTTSQPGQQAHKVKHTHRVERLIHIELAAKRVMRDCRVCGMIHREWFEIEASQKAIAEVDAITRKWVSWADNVK